MNSKLGLPGTYSLERVVVHYQPTFLSAFSILLCIRAALTQHTFVCCSIGTILYDGRPEERRLLRDKNFDGEQFNVLLTHYDLILKDKKFLKKVHWHYLIVDEGHRLKNHECALARTLVSG
jgi:hypothetical protein